MEIYMIVKNSVLAMCLLSLMACATTTNEPDDSAKTVVPVGVCKEPRPQMCTMDYTPVCANVAGKTLKTYGNACGACGDVNVNEYVKGECITDDVNAFPNQASGDSAVKKSSN